MSGDMKKLFRQNFCYLDKCILQTRNTKKLVSHYMTLYFSDNSYFKVTMKLLMAQLHNTDLLKASSVKLQDIKLMSTYIS